MKWKTEYTEKALLLFQKKNWLFWLGMAGILLIFLSDVLFVSEENSTEEAQPIIQQDALAQYELQLTQQLTSMLSVVEGAGEVQVMLTLETTGENIYAENEERETQVVQTEPMQQDSSTKTELVILQKDDTGEEPLMLTTIYPEVKGVAVVCQGAEDIIVVKRITDLVSVVLGISTNRVCVEKMTTGGNLQ